MKTKYKHIHFRNVSDLYPKRKTQVWSCFNHAGIYLGAVEWKCGWRQYCFNVDENVLFSAGCLHDIIDFINHLHAERRNAKKRKT